MAVVSRIKEPADKMLQIAKIVTCKNEDDYKAAKDEAMRL